MKFKPLKPRTVFAIVGSIPALFSFGYFGRYYWPNYDVLSKKRDNSKESKDYIELSNPLYDLSFNDYPEDNIRPPDKSSRTHLKLLGVVRTNRDPNITELAISAILNTRFHEYQMRELAQSCDFQTAVRLARTQGINHQLFLPPISTQFMKLDSNPKSCFDLNQVLLKLMNSALLTGDQCSECTKYFTQLSIEMLETGSHSRQIHESVDFNEIHFMKRHRPSKFPAVEWLYLQSIHNNILCGDNQCKTMADNGLFLFLNYLRANFSETEVHDWIAQTLANLSAHKATHWHFWSGRWISILVQWLQSGRLEWSLPAAKILHNLSDESVYLIPESIYQLHPIYRDKSNKEFDIILVHGLLGGTFKTWRQNDSQNLSQEYTKCWPQKWLIQDVDSLRILAVNYKTFLSNWNIECHDSNSVFTLKQRSSQLLNDLIASHVGQKPIIWITHSMGGLLVKQMLVDSEESDDLKVKSILNQTKGIVFFSVPHKGSDMAVRSPYLQRVMSPSSEVLTLRKDSFTLHSLHNKFLNLMSNKPIQCLSFGETLKSTVIKRPFKWKQFLVPEDSADPGIGEFYLLNVDHFNTCKPVNKSSESYERTLHFIRHVIEVNKSKESRETDNIPILLTSLFT